MKLRIFIVLLALVAGYANAGSIKNWVAPERVKASDLNDALNHLHDSAGHGHGEVITNNDISGSAQISHSKLATPALVPKAFGYVSAVCAAGTCTLGTSSQVTSVAFNATGVYDVTLSYTPVDALFAPVAASHTADLYCVTSGQSTSAPHFVVTCNDAAGTDTNAAFSFVVMD